jgi:hypothetical protein
MKEGFVIGGGFIVVGLLLQLMVGSLNWAAFARPVNLFILAAFLLMICIAAIIRKNNYPLHFLTTHRAAVPALVYAAGLTVIMGLTRQTGDGGWFSDMLTFWPFVLIYAYLEFLLGLIIIRRLSHMFRHKKHHHSTTRRSWRHDVAFLLNHAGLFVTLLCATLGNPDMHRMRLAAYQGEMQWQAIDDHQNAIQAPVGITLQRFILEEYPDGSPRRYASDILIQTRNGKKYTATVEVNKPVKINGWNIYQYGYDVERGAQSQYSVLEVVSDPWLPAVYVGIFMMLAGALSLFLIRSTAAAGISDAELEKEREKRRAKKAREAEKRKLAEEFRGEHHHHHHHHHHSGGDSDSHSHYHTER